MTRSAEEASFYKCMPPTISKTALRKKLFRKRSSKTIHFSFLEEVTTIIDIVFGMYMYVDSLVAEFASLIFFATI
jgi:hypothetical protein